MSKNKHPWSTMLYLTLWGTLFMLILLPGKASSQLWDRFTCHFSQKDSYVARVDRVLDGDSIKIIYCGETLSLRLWGIDAPEYGQPYSSAGKKFLRKTLLHKKVRVESLATDKFGRVVARVYHEGESINQILVEKGYAWVHIAYCREPICADWRQLEKNAKSKRIGLWQQKDPTPPWRWKRENH